MAGPPAAQQPVFIDEARPAIAECSRAWRAALANLGVDPADGPTRVARALETDAKLAWKLVHLTAQESDAGTDPLLIGRFVPGSRATRRLLEGLTAGGLGRGDRRRIELATKAFEQLVRRYSGDRASFDLLLDGAGSASSSATELEQRRAAMRANSYLYGVRAGLQIKLVAMAPGARDPARFDAAIVTGFVGLERIRDHVPWRLVESHSIDDRGQVARGDAVTPLDPRVCAGEAPLLFDFCEPAPPSLSAVARIGSATEFALTPVEPRLRRRETCFAGELLRSLEPRRRTAEHEYNAIAMRLRTPCEEAVLDVLLERGLFGPRTRYEPKLFSSLFAGRQPGPYLDQDRLSIEERVEGPSSLDAVGLEAFPGYPQLIAALFERTGWDARRFELHRIRIAFPVVPTDLVLGTRLAEQP